MIQLNLLPDVKLDYIKAERTRRLVLSVSFIVTAVAVVLLVLVLSVDLAQKKHLSDLNRDITSESSTLENKPQIAKILTVQNQLESLTALHAAKPAASRLLDTYLDEVTPTSVAINSFNIDFTQQTATITGTADSLTTINQYVDTLKFTTYTSNTVTTATNAFSNVVLSSFGLNSDSTDPSQAASYTITLSYDKNIFDTTQTVTLSVPHLVTTRSEIDQPGDLFKAAPATSSSTTSGGGQ
jgi:hypothetical protein